MTATTTTGYGDYTGGTKAEYLYTLFIEFTGVIVFVVLMYLVGNIVADDDTFELFFQERILQFDIWYTRIEKCKQAKHMSSELYLDMYDNIAVAMYSDYNIIIEEYPFFEKISPNLQTKLIKLLFKDFIRKFEFFFDDME